MHNLFAIYLRVLLLNNSIGTDDILFIMILYIRSFIKFSDVILSKKSVVHSIRCEQKVKTTVWPMATITKLVSNIFENVTSKPRRFFVFMSWKEREGGGMEGRKQ